MADGRAQFVAAMERDPADRGLDHATIQATAAVRGIIRNGPIQRVSEELARLDREAERAEQAAERWEQTSNRLDAQRAAHRAENDENTAMLRRAEEEAARVRAQVAAPLTKQAERDGADYLASAEAERTASTRLATVGRIGRRKARDEHRTAREQKQTMRDHVRDAWEAEPPRTRARYPNGLCRSRGGEQRPIPEYAALTMLSKSLAPNEPQQMSVIGTSVWCSWRANTGRRTRVLTNTGCAPSTLLVTPAPPALVQRCFVPRTRKSAAFP